jgi:hypothetical protein
LAGKIKVAIIELNFDVHHDEAGMDAWDVAEKFGCGDADVKLTVNMKTNEKKSFSFRSSTARRIYYSVFTDDINETLTDPDVEEKERKAYLPLHDAMCEDMQ